MQWIVYLETENEPTGDVTKIGEFNKLSEAKSFAANKVVETGDIAWVTNKETGVCIEYAGTYA